MADLSGLPPQVSPPNFTVDSDAPHLIRGVDAVALPVLRDGGRLLLGPGAAEVGAALDADLLGILDAVNANGEAGEVTTVPVAAGVEANPDLRCLLLVGVGECRPQDFRRAGAALARAVTDRTAVATTIPAVDPQAGLEPFVVGVVLGSFVFHWRSTRPGHRPVERVVLAELTTADQEAVDQAATVGRAGWLCRALATVPSNLKNPAWLAHQAQELAGPAGLTVKVWDEHELAEAGFGGLVGVGQASVSPPRLIRLDYQPRGRRKRGTPTVVLVGKGITFDTGGLSIKPGEAMVNMKRDMTGGAVVMATMAALADVHCQVRVVGLVAAAENAVGGNALRPGDVVAHYGGRTTEITNTDAEGRLVMADALAYAVEELDPAVIVDVATLTGAVKVALGQQVGGIFANDDALAAALMDAGESAGEPFWRLPLAEVYEQKLSSGIADADNAGAGPGAIIAALFLRHFVGDVPWAHLDIASVGDAPEQYHEWTAGPTGFGARALLKWLSSPDPLAGIGAG